MIVRLGRQNVISWCDYRWCISLGAKLLLGKTAASTTSPYNLKILSAVVNHLAWDIFPAGVSWASSVEHTCSSYYSTPKKKYASIFLPNFFFRCIYRFLVEIIWTRIFERFFLTKKQIVSNFTNRVQIIMNFASNPASSI